MTPDFHWITQLPMELLGKAWNVQACSFCGVTWKPSERTKAQHPEKFFADGRYIPPDKCPYCDARHWNESVWEWLDRICTGDMLDNRCWKDQGRIRVTKFGADAQGGTKKMRKTSRMTRDKRVAMVGGMYADKMKWLDAFWGSGQGLEFFKSWVEVVVRKPQKNLRAGECGVEAGKNWWWNQIVDRTRESKCCKGNPVFLISPVVAAHVIAGKQGEANLTFPMTFPSPGPYELLYLPPPTFNRRQPKDGRLNGVKMTPTSWPERTMAMFITFAREFEVELNKITPGLVVELIGEIKSRKLSLQIVTRGEMDRVIDSMARTIVEGVI